MNILITGVSSGIGWGLAKHYLSDGHHVIGLSRRDCHFDDPKWRFAKVDLSATSSISTPLSTLVTDVPQWDLVVLNAGRLGEIGDLKDAELEDLQLTMTVNVWSNKFVLDTVFAKQVPVKQVVAISSGASVLGNRGWSGYSISKAALNMFVKLYAREQSDTHFCALAPGLVDTEIQETLCTLPSDERFPGLDGMRAKRGTPEMPRPEDISARLARIMSRLPSLVESGTYADIRDAPLSDV